MRYFLGIDGGQTSTTCLVGDESGSVIAMGRSGPANHPGESAKFRAAIEDGLRSAGFLDAAFASACLGLSGGPAHKDALTRQVVRAEKYFITHDAMIALAGATAGAPGIVIIAGTGSIAFGRNAGGHTARAGGWGYIFGDEGGAFDIVRQALRAVLREEEGWGPPTALRDLLEDARDANDLLHRFYTEDYPRARIAALAPRVDEAARAGDPIAQEILNRAAQSLATITGAVHGQLFQGDADIRYIGGVFRSDVVRERYRMLVEMGFGEKDDHCRVSPPIHGPAAGALLEAYRIAGITCTLKNVPEEK